MSDLTLTDLIPLSAQAVDAADALLSKARIAVAKKVSVDGKPTPALLEKEQVAAHGLAWLPCHGRPAIFIAG